MRPALPPRPANDNRAHPPAPPLFAATCRLLSSLDPPPPRAPADPLKATQRAERS